MTIVTGGDDQVIEQITKQLHKVIEVIKVSDVTQEPFVQRELALIKISARPEQRPEIMQIINVFEADIVDICPSSLTVQATGGEEKVNAIVGMLKPFGLKEVARTGSIAMKREFREPLN